jgi:hypothetical protein
VVNSISTDVETSRRGAPPGLRICDREECQLAGVLRKGARVYCSTKHWYAHAERRASRPRCPACRLQFDRVSSRPGTVGRAATFCGDTCKRARERELERAVRELGRDVVAGVDLAELLSRSQLLWATWFGKPGDDWVERFWFGHVPPRTGDVPDVRVKRALWDRINRLAHLAAEQDRQTRKERQHEADRATDERLRKARDAARVEENAWRADPAFVEQKGD